MSGEGPIFTGSAKAFRRSVWMNTRKPSTSGTRRSSRPSPFTSWVTSTWGISVLRGGAKLEETASSGRSVPDSGSNQLRRPGSKVTSRSRPPMSGHVGEGHFGTQSCLESRNPGAVAERVEAQEAVAAAVDGQHRKFRDRASQKKPRQNGLAFRQAGDDLEPLETEFRGDRLPDPGSLRGRESRQEHCKNQQGKPAASILAPEPCQGGLPAPALMVVDQTDVACVTLAGTHVNGRPSTGAATAPGPVRVPASPGTPVE